MAFLWRGLHEEDRYQRFYELSLSHRAHSGSRWKARRFAVVDVNEKENCYDSCLWTMDLFDGSVRKLTSGRKGEEFFLDRRGNASHFAGCREKEYKDKIEDGETWTCFYTIGLHGGEAEFSFAVPYAVGKFAVCGNKVFMSVKYEYSQRGKGL